jgi:hypothetical protein
MALHAVKPEIGGANSTVRVAVLNETAATALADATAGLDAEDWALPATVTVDRELLRTYYERPPNGTTGTFAVYHPEMDALTVHLGEEFEGQDMVDLTVIGGELPSMSRLWDTHGAEGVAWYILNRT